MLYMIVDKNVCITKYVVLLHVLIRVLQQGCFFYFVVYILTKALLYVAEQCHYVSYSIFPMHLVIVDYIYKCLIAFNLKNKNKSFPKEMIL